MGLNFEDIFDLSNQDEVNQNVINIPTPVGGGADTNVQSQPFLTKDQAKNLAVGASDFGIIMAPGGATLEAAGQAPDPFSGGKLPGFSDIVSDAYGDFKSGDIVGGLAGTGEGILQALGVAGDTAQLYAPALGVAAPIVFAAGTGLKFPNATKNLLKGIFQATKNLPKNQTTQQATNLSTAQQATNFVGEANTIQEAINNAPVEIRGEIQKAADRMLEKNNPPDRILNMIQGKVQALGKTRVSKEAPNLNLISAGTNYNTKYENKTKSPNETIRRTNFFDDIVLIRPTHYNAELVAEKILKDNPDGVKGSDLYNQIMNTNIKNNKITETEMSDANLSFLKDSDNIFEFYDTKDGKVIFNANTGDIVNLDKNPNKLTLSSSFISDINKKLGKINNIQELTLSSNDRKLISEARQEVFRDAEAAGRLGPVSGISSMLNSQNIGDKLLSKSFLQTKGNELFKTDQRIEGSAGKGEGEEIIDYGFITINNAGKPDSTGYGHGVGLKGHDDERLAHARVSVRVLDGKKYLVIEELQSDFSIKTLGTKEKPGKGFKNVELQETLQNKVDANNKDNQELLLNLNPDVSPLTEVRENMFGKNIVFKNNTAREEFFGPELEEILKLRDQVIENSLNKFLELEDGRPFQFSLYPTGQLGRVSIDETEKLLNSFNNEFQFPGVNDDMVREIIADSGNIFGGYNLSMTNIFEKNIDYVNKTLGYDQNTFKANMLHIVNEIKNSDQIDGNNTLEVYRALLSVYPKFKNEKIVFNDFNLIETSNRNPMNLFASQQNATEVEKKNLATLFDTLYQIQRTVKRLDDRDSVNNIIDSLQKSNIKINTDVVQNNTFNAIANNLNNIRDDIVVLNAEKEKLAYQPIVKPEQWGKLLMKDVLDVAANKNLDGVVFPNNISFQDAGGRQTGVISGYNNLREVFKNTAKEIGKDADSVKFNTKLGDGEAHTVIEVDTITEPKSKSVYKQGGLVGSLNGINVLDLGEARNG